MTSEYLKIPIEMAQFALTERKVNNIACYIASQFLYSGKIMMKGAPREKLAKTIGVSRRSVRRYIEWLISRDWICVDEVNNWLFFRGIDRIHRIEGWKYQRAAIMVPQDLLTAKEFFIGAVLSSIVKTGRGAGTERLRRRSETSRFPISLSTIEKVLGVSRKTAYTYRKDAERYRYIKMEMQLVQVDISPKEVMQLKHNNIDRVRLQLFGSPHTIKVKPDQLRIDHGYVYAQLANFVEPRILLKNRGN